MGQRQLFRAARSVVPLWLLFGKPTGITYALIMGAGWALNLCLAERLT